MAVTDQTAQQPLTQQPPAQSNAAQDTALAAVAATLLPTPTFPAALSVDAAAIMTTKLLEALRKFQNQREAGFQDELNAEATRFGPSLQEAAGNLIQRELGYESTFRGKQFDRVSDKLTNALLLPDKAARDAKIKQVFEDERRYTHMREAAMRKRVIMGLEHYTLEGVSPDGAFWQLGEAKMHTPDCVAMSGKHWPWMVLHDFQPPVHPRCACRLVSTQSAIAHGLMDENDVRDPMDAQAEAIQALRLAQEARDAGADWIDLEEAYDLRYAKGTEFAGRFKPRVGGDPGATLLRKLGLLGRGQRRSPLRDSDGHWTRLGGRSVRIPHAEWSQAIHGIRYSSPEGSTNVYREGQLISPPVSSEDPGKIHQLVDTVRQQLRSKVSKRSGPPLRRGDGPEAVNSMEARGYDMTDVAPAGKGVWRASWSNRGGIDNVHALITHKGVRSARWDTVPIDRQRAGATQGPPASFAAHTADMKAWSGELADRYGSHNRIRDISVDSSMEDHAGYKQWNGDIRLGRDVQPDLERAAGARAAGRPLTDSELRGVYASMWASAHEVSHTVNPLAAKDADPASANLEEALTEENAHRLASERLASQGQADVLDWARRNPTNLVVKGVYRQQRGGLADLFDRAGLSDEQRARMVEQLKFNVNPKDRFKVLGGLLRQKDAGLSEQQAEDDARQALTSGSSRPRAASLQSPGIPGKWKDAYEHIGKYVSSATLPVEKPDAFKRVEPVPKRTIGGDVKEPKTQGPIPSYRHVRLELGGKDFATGAQKATDADGRPWIVQQHDSDKDRVASELLAGAVYNALGVAVAQPGSVQTEPVPDFSTTPDSLADEPPLPESGRLSTGVILRDKNGKVTVVEPRNHYGGYIHTFPKGGVEKGLTPQQNAKKELWEEAGLHAHITGVVGDFKGDTGMTRYYEGVKTGGVPTVSDETQAVKSVSPKDAVEMLNKDRDKKVLSAVLERPIPTGKFKDDFPAMKPGVAAAYPVPEGKKMDVTKNNAAVSRDYMADALLGNWDFVGDHGANLRFNGDDHPTRMNLGSSFESSPSGRSKPYDGTPSDVWTMLRRGQARGRVNLTDAEMRAQAGKIADSLTPDKINEMVKAAPFADEETRKRIGDNLASRVRWMRDYGNGLVDLPKPAEGDAAKDMMSKAFEHFDLFPEEQAALDDYTGPMRDTIDGIARDKKPAGKPEATAMGRLDDAIDATETPDDLHAWVTLPSGAGAGLAGKTVQQRSYTPLMTDEPEGPKMRVMIPGGSRALYMGDDTKPGESNILLPRGARLQVDGVDTDGSTVHATLLPYTKPPKVLPPHTPYKHGQFNTKPWETTSTKPSPVQSHDFKVGDRVQFAGGKTPYRVVNASPLMVKGEDGITTVPIQHPNDLEHIEES